MAFNKGFHQRATRRVYVLRGFEGCKPETFTYQAPASDGNSRSILSGDVISLDGGEWVLGAANGVKPYIALSDESDPDVRGSGLVPALDCSGKFEIETVRYDTDANYDQDTPLAAATAGDLGLLTANALNGSSDIIGHVTRGGERALNPDFSAGERGPKREFKSDMSGTDGNVISFTTNWQPLNVV